MDNLLLLKQNVRLDMDRYIEDGYSPVELAAVFASEAMFIYRQLFDDKDYDMMMESIYESRKNIKRLPMFY